MEIDHQSVSMKQSQINGHQPLLAIEVNMDLEALFSTYRTSPWLLSQVK